MIKRKINQLIIFFFVLLLFSCDEAKDVKKYKIGFSQRTGFSARRKQMLQSMQGELAFFPELELIYKDAENSSERQVKDIEEFIKMKVDVLIVSPNESEPVTPVVEKAFQSGIPVIMMEKISSSMYTAYIGSDNHEIGKLAGNYAAELLKGKGSILEIWGLEDSSPAKERHEGFWEQLAKYPDIKREVEIYGKWEFDSTKLQFQKRIDNLPEVDLVFAHNDIMAYAAYTVYRRLWPGNKIKFIGIDALPGPVGGIQFVNDKILTASFLNPTGGEECIRLANQIVKGLPFKKENTLLSTVIDAKNVRVMNLQHDKLLSQQIDIVRQQGKINEQIQVYYSQRILIGILLVSLVIMIIAGAIAAYYWREKIEINKRLEAKRTEILKQRNTIAAMAEKAEFATQEKLRFFTNISHEFKTPLTLIMGPIEELMSKGPNSKVNATENLSLIRKNAMRLLRLVNQLMDFRKIEDRKMLLKASELDIIYFISDVMTAFEKLAQKRKIDFKLITEHKQLYVWFDPDMLDKVIFNLLSNAFKFTNDRGKVYVTVSIDPGEKNVVIGIEDNGVGISPEHIQNAFDRFYTGENVSGNGIGLSLSKEFVELHHGEIVLNSEKGKGTRFTIFLPFGNKHFDEQQLVSGTYNWKRNSNFDFINDHGAHPTVDKSADNVAHKDHTVLLIEDNTELRQFVKNRLASVYNIEEAYDGITGIRLAFEIVPDIIVCDVMLPGKDGFEVVKTLKGDLRTSHIPMIILTAKGSMEHRIVGIQTGADEYITKPFVLEYLHERIKALIRTRELLKQHYSQDLNIGPNVSSPGGLDRKFINDFTAMIEKHMSNADLHVNEISRELAMSRVQVYRKVKALLGYSVNDYIINVRLKKAKHLLLNSDKSISEISTEVGFSSPTYFSTAFKGKFNMSPRDFKSAQTNLLN